MSKTDKNTLEKELKFYVKHQNEFLKSYLGKFLLIKDEKLIGAFDTSSDAYDAGKSKFELGTFLIQKCEPGNESYTQVYHSRAIF